MSNKYLEKLAEMSTETKKELVSTGVLAGLGGAGNLLADKLMGRFGKSIPSKYRTPAVFGLGTAIGLGTDYAGVKAINVINERHKK